LVTLEQLTPGTTIRGLLPDGIATVIAVKWYGTTALDLTYRDGAGNTLSQIVTQDDEPRIEIAQEGRPWSLDGDGADFQLAAEAHRIRLAHLFDPLLAVHTSVVEPLPHQITAVYGAMLKRQPLRFLLADDPGAGKTIMAGLLIKELIARGDLQRCLIVCPGSLVEQWQDELLRKFNLNFAMMTSDSLQAAATGNWFVEHNLVIARLDMLARNEELHEKLQVPEAHWDLVVCDEAHKMSASFFNAEVKYTKRYKLGQLLSSLTRNFLLMSATPHNGKDEDFQLFMALLDGDRFEGRFRDGVHAVDVSDMMRRMVKEELLKFDGKPLFPERIAYTQKYRLSPMEERLYAEVSEYVKQEFNRAEALENDKRAGTVGFALTVLQRRLASSPEAIYQSLRRRRERLEAKLREAELVARGMAVQKVITQDVPELDEEDIEDLEDSSGAEQEETEEKVVDQATAARTIEELRQEIASLQRLEALANQVRNSGDDRKWSELAGLLGQIFTPNALRIEAHDSGAVPIQDIPRHTPSPNQKLVIFTEHRDTLAYLERKIGTLLGDPASIRTIHGGVGREARLAAQESFKFDPSVRVLIATDAAGEGINLQRAHLMVNYDLPWNPNRLEQRFGRIHRIGQREVCHLWNLVAADTREGEVYIRLLEKLDLARRAMGGRVFDVLGKVQFTVGPDGRETDKPRLLRDLLLEAIRYGERPDVRARLDLAVDTAFDSKHIQDLFEEEALEKTTMDTRVVQQIRADMERAEQRRLQPHFIERFFKGAFAKLGGRLSPKETGRFQVTHVPGNIINRDRQIGVGEPVLPRYERIAFDKQFINPEGQKLAAYVCPGHPLLDSTIDLTLERYRDLLRQGTVLVDERDYGTQPRMLFILEHSIQDGRQSASGLRRTISRRMLYVEIGEDRTARHIQYAPYLDYRPLKAGEGGVAEILSKPECAWLAGDLEELALDHAIRTLVIEHRREVEEQRLELIAKTEAAVQDRLSKEINYWDKRAQDLRMQEEAGKTNAKLNWQQARGRADQLQQRLLKRLAELKAEKQIAPLPPVVVGGVLVVPAGLLGIQPAGVRPVDTQASAARARAAVMEIERSLGFEPVDREFERLGYDIESRDPATGKLRFIEVKGRVEGADTITVTCNEVMHSLNNPESFILAMVEHLDDGAPRVSYLRGAFQREPDVHATAVLYKFAELLARAGPPS